MHAWRGCSRVPARGEGGVRGRPEARMLVGGGRGRMSVMNSGSDGEDAEVAEMGKRCSDVMGS